MQSAIAKIHVHLFLFYADAINWSKSKRRIKVMRSLESSFPERFADLLRDIHSLPVSVQRVAATGSAAQGRDLRFHVGLWRDDVRTD